MQERIDSRAGRRAFRVRGGAGAGAADDAPGGHRRGADAVRAGAAGARRLRVGLLGLALLPGEPSALAFALRHPGQLRQVPAPAPELRDRRDGLYLQLQHGEQPGPARPAEHPLHRRHPVPLHGPHPHRPVRLGRQDLVRPARHPLLQPAPLLLQPVQVEQADLPERVRKGEAHLPRGDGRRDPAGRRTLFRGDGGPETL